MTSWQILTSCCVFGVMSAATQCVPLVKLNSNSFDEVIHSPSGDDFAAGSSPFLRNREATSAVGFVELYKIIDIY